MLYFHIDGSLTKREKLGECLLWVGLRNASDELMNGTDGIGSNVCAGVVEYYVQGEVEQRVRKVNADVSTR